MLPLLAALLLVGLAGIYLTWVIVKKDLEEQVVQRGRLAAHSIQYAVETSSTLSGVQRYVSALGAEADVVSALVVAGTPARVIASTRLALVGRPVRDIASGQTATSLHQALESRQPSHGFHADRHQFNYAAPVLITNVMSQGVPLGRGALTLQLRTDTLDSAIIYTLVTLGALFGSLLVALAAVLAWLVHHFVLAPQRRLLDTVTARRRGDKVLTTISGGNEFARLGQAFNDMLRANDAMEKLKSEFVSTVSHELRTPLTSIRGALGLVLGAEAKHLPSNTARLLDMANRNVERLNALVNDILDLEKIENGGLEFRFEKLDLVALTRRAVEANAGYAKEYDVRLTCTDLPGRVLVNADDQRIAQVFANLLSNAAKYAPAGSEVSISMQAMGPYMRIAIRDRGPGIPAEFADRIFQRFAQADSSDTREKGGTGLGLHISKTIVERHQGRIAYHTKPGWGTEFYFDIPVWDELEDASEASPHSRSAA